MIVYESFTDTLEYAREEVKKINEKYNAGIFDKQHAIKLLNKLYDDLHFLNKLDSEEDDFNYSLLLLGIRDLINQYTKLK